MTSPYLLRLTPKHAPIFSFMVPSMHRIAIKLRPPAILRLHLPPRLVLGFCARVIISKPLLLNVHHAHLKALCDLWIHTPHTHTHTHTLSLSLSIYLSSLLSQSKCCYISTNTLGMLKSWPNRRLRPTISIAVTYAWILLKSLYFVEVLAPCMTLSVNKDDTHKHILSLSRTHAYSSPEVSLKRYLMIPYLHRCIKRTIDLGCLPIPMTRYIFLKHKEYAPQIISFPCRYLCMR